MALALRFWEFAFWGLRLSVLQFRFLGFRGLGLIAKRVRILGLGFRDECPWALESSSSNGSAVAKLQA